MRVFGLLALLLAGLIFVFLAAKQLDLLKPFIDTKKTTSIESNQPLDAPLSIAEKANLNAIASKLNLYYVENGKYPNSLNELEPNSQNFDVFEYEVCNSNKAIIKLGSSTMVLTNGNAVLDKSASC